MDRGISRKMATANTTAPAQIPVERIKWRQRADHYEGDNNTFIWNIKLKHSPNGLLMTTGVGRCVCGEWPKIGFRQEGNNAKLWYPEKRLTKATRNNSFTLGVFLIKKNRQERRLEENKWSDGKENDIRRLKIMRIKKILNYHSFGTRRRSRRRQNAKQSDQINQVKPVDNSQRIPRDLHIKQHNFQSLNNFSRFSGSKIIFDCVEISNLASFLKLAFLTGRQQTLPKVVPLESFLL